MALVRFLPNLDHVGAAHRLLRRVTVLALAASVIWASVAAGSSYLWCVPMQRVMRTACCGGAEHGRSLSAPHREATLRATDCCETRQLGSLPLSDRRDGAATPVRAAALLAPAVAVVPPPRRPILRGHLASPAPVHAHRAIRAGPTRMMQRLAWLQVMLT